MEKLFYNDKLRMQTLREQGLGAKAIISSYPRALLRKSAVESTALAQQFCVNQAVGDLRPATCSHISGTMLIIDCG